MRKNVAPIEICGIDHASLEATTLRDCGEVELARLELPLWPGFPLAHRISKPSRKMRSLSSRVTNASFPSFTTLNFPSFLQLWPVAGLIPTRLHHLRNGYESGSSDIGMPPFWHVVCFIHRSTPSLGKAVAFAG